MFSTRGLFKDVTCPGAHDCTLPNCLFKHDSRINLGTSVPLYDPDSSTVATEPESPRPRKRQRISSPLQINSHKPNAKEPDIAIGDVVRDSSCLNKPDLQKPGTDSIKPLPEISVTKSIPTATLPSKQKSDNTGTENGCLESEHKPAVIPTSANHLVSVTRKISPPPVTRATKPYRRSINSKSFAPRPVDHPPVRFEMRDGYLKKLHKLIEDANARYRKDFPTKRAYHLNKLELETQAMDDESSLARTFSTADNYKSALAARLASYNAKNMTPTKWEDLIKKSWLTDPNTTPAISSTTSKQPVTKIDTGLSSVDQEIAVLKHLRTGLQQYAKFGYVTKQPAEQAILEAKKIREGPMGYSETCDRCGSRFTVFPGRNKAGDLTSGGKCTYHYARALRTNGRASYPCCGQGTESTGCTTSPHHVFKVTDPARLALLLPFKETPPNDKAHGPVVFDCEMSYTTLGLELVRLTALAWPTHKTLLDVLVRPIGEILDMNTRFSGVTNEMMSGAKDYGTVPRPRYEANEALQRVASPAAAREFLFDLINPDTPLLGHAIENDLNAVRIIHPFVIDTVLLYPHVRGLPNRNKLKDLARLFLARDIQTSGAEGHDSKEDSIATGDLVRKKVGERWMELKRLGFKFVGNVLTR